MTTCALDAGLLYSDLAADADLADLVDLFVCELPGRLRELETAIGQDDVDLVRQLAHQLRGAGGSYGFPALGPPAGELEQAARRCESIPILVLALEDLAEVSSRVRAGTA
jgi:HPt (histidine-containing phosphotransfer) domain-containing protein